MEGRKKQSKTGQLQLGREVRIRERNNSAYINVSEEGGAMGTN